MKTVPPPVLPHHALSTSPRPKTTNAAARPACKDGVRPSYAETDRVVPAPANIASRKVHPPIERAARGVPRRGGRDGSAGHCRS